MQQRTAEKNGGVPETASQDRRLQRTVEQAFVDRAEAEKMVESCFQLWRIGSWLREVAKVAFSKSKGNVAGLVSEWACKFLPSVL